MSFGKRYARHIRLKQKSTDSKMTVSAHRFTQDINKPALVLVHGLGSAGNIWNSLVPQLIEDFTVYAIDLPGHGQAPLTEGEELDPRSLAQSIVDYIVTDMGVERMHVAGNSLGGWIALEMVVPEKVKHSVVFGDEDLTVPEEIAQQKSVAPAHSRWIVVDNCAHVIMWNYPDLTVDLIKKTALIAS